MNFKLKIFNSILNTQYSILFFILIICHLSTVNCQLTYAAYGDAKLTVNADVRTESLTLEPQASATPTPGEGQFYFNDNTSQPYYYDGTVWKVISGGAGGAGDKNVATKIVAAFDSQDKDTKADYICDGVNDQVEIQTAIDALGTTGGVVYLLEGTYNISGSINLDNTAPNDSGKAIIGAGKGTMLKETSGNFRLIFIMLVDRIFISNLSLFGDLAGGGAGIECQASNYNKISNVWIENMSDDGINFYNCDNNIVSGNFIKGNKGSGIHLMDTSDNNIISDNIVEGNTGTEIGYLGSGVLIWRSSNNTVSDNVVRNNICFGITTRSDSHYNIISGNISTGNSQSGIGLGAWWLTPNCHYNVISSNISQNNGDTGILLITSNNNSITGNIIQGNKTSGIYFSNSSYNVASGNLIDDTIGDGISFDSNATFNVISANNIIDTPAIYYVFKILGNNNYFSGNIYSGAGSSVSLDNGNNNQYTDKIKVTFQPASAQNITTDLTTLNPGVSSYVPLNPSGNFNLNATTAISDGKSAGDLLILENISDPINNYIVTIPHNANTKLKTGVNKSLSPDEIIIFIWNGSDWVQIGGDET